jgi:hypothetical protein
VGLAARPAGAQVSVREEFMNIRAISLALPVLALGLACKTSGSTSGSAQAEPAQGSSTATATSKGDTGITGSASSDMKGHASDRVVSGRVASASDDELVIESDQGSRQTLRIVDETLVTVDGQDRKATDLKEGQQVRASFNELEGKQVAVKVEAGGMGSGSMGGTSGSMGTTGTTGSTGGESGTQGPGGSSSTSPSDQSGTSTRGTSDTGTSGTSSSPSPGYEPPQGRSTDGGPSGSTTQPGTADSEKKGSTGGKW